MDSESKSVFIGTWLETLIAVLGKRVADGTLPAIKHAFCNALEDLPEKAIVAGFRKAEQELERFPTPKQLREICAEFLPKHTTDHPEQTSRFRLNGPPVLDLVEMVMEELHPSYKQHWTQGQLSDEELNLLAISANRERYRRMGRDPDNWDGRKKKSGT